MKRFKRPISEVAKGLFHQGSGDSKPLVPNLGVNSKNAQGDSPLHMTSPAKRGKVPGDETNPPKPKTNKKKLNPFNLGPDGKPKDTQTAAEKAKSRKDFIKIHKMTPEKFSEGNHDPVSDGPRKPKAVAKQIKGKNLTEKQSQTTQGGAKVDLLAMSESDRKDRQQERKSKSTSYADAYKKRDMKTYGNLSQAEFTKEAKRQNANRKATKVKATPTSKGKEGKWDAPKSQMKGSVTGPKTKGGDANNKQVVGVGNKPTDKKVDVVDSKKDSKVVVAKKNLKQIKKDNKVEKINAKAEVASAKGKTKKADRLKARAERKETGKSKKDQGRNIFGRKTKAQKAKEAAAAAPGKYGKVKK